MLEQGKWRYKSLRRARQRYTVFTVTPITFKRFFHRSTRNDEGNGIVRDIQKPNQNLKAMEQHEKTKFYHAFDPVSPTDPKEDLRDFIEEISKGLIEYSKKSYATQSSINKRYKEIQRLESILERLQNIRLYPVWATAERKIEAARNEEVDGAWMAFPFVKNPRSDRYAYIDLAKETNLL